jgi:hypothetical protein
LYVEIEYLALGILIMSSREKSATESYDFLLVTTYVPVIVLCARATVIVLLVHWLVFFLEIPWHAVAMVTACLVFIDAWMMRSHGLDSVCGYMCMCALALLTQPLKQRCAESTGGFLWFEDFAWSFVSTFEVVSSVSGMCIPVPFVLKISIGCALAVFHVIGSCASIGALEMVLRAVIFYVMCAVSLMCLKFTNVRDAERRNYTSMIPHASMHVFYVHLYAALAGFLLVLGVHGRLVFEYGRRSASADIEQPAHSPRPRRGAEKKTLEWRPEAAGSRDDRDEYSELVRKLHAAKAASGVA